MKHHEGHEEHEERVEDHDCFVLFVSFVVLLFETRHSRARRRFGCGFAAMGLSVVPFLNAITLPANYADYLFA